MKSFLRTLALLAAWIPPLWLLFVVTRLGVSYPIQDEREFVYGAAKFLFSGPPDWGWIFARHDIYYLPGLKFIYYLLGALFHWNLRIAQLFNVSVTLLSLGAVCHLIRQTVQDAEARPWFYLMASVFFCSFTTDLHYLAAWGWIWLMQSLLLLIVILWLRPPVQPIPALLLCLGLALFATLCHGGIGLNLWLAIPGYIYLRGNFFEGLSRGRIWGIGALWIMATAISFWVMFSHDGGPNRYETALGVPADALSSTSVSPLRFLLGHPFKIFACFILFLGSPVAHGLNLFLPSSWSSTQPWSLIIPRPWFDRTVGILAGVSGGLSFGLFCGSLVWFLRERRKTASLNPLLSPWLALAAMQAIIAAMAAAVRAGNPDFLPMGPYDAHYDTAGLYFQPAAYIAAFIALRHLRQEHSTSPSSRVPLREKGWSLISILLPLAGAASIFLVVTSQPWAYNQNIWTRHQYGFFRGCAWLYPFLVEQQAKLPESLRDPAYMACVVPLGILKTAPSEIDVREKIRIAPLVPYGGLTRFLSPGAGFYIDSSTGDVSGSQTLLIQYRLPDGSSRFRAAESIIQTKNSRRKRFAVPTNASLFFFFLGPGDVVETGAAVEAIYALRGDRSFAQVYVQHS